MRSFFKLSTLALGVLSITACNSSDSDPEESAEISLQRHLQTAGAFDLRVVEGDLLATTSDNLLYRLAANDDEWEVLASNSSSYNFILTPTSQYYALLDNRLDRIRLSRDAGQSWESVTGMNLPPADAYSSMLLIGSAIYMHVGEGLHRTYLDMSSHDGGVTELEVLHESSTAERYRFENRVRALVHNDVRNQLWWNEFGSEDDANYRVMRMNLNSEEIEQVFSHESNPLFDGFVDDSDPSTLVFAGDGGVRISHDNGENWTRHYMEENLEPVVYSVEQDLISLNYYAYASVDIDGVRTDEMWCSPDQGASWERTRLGEGNSGVRNATNSMVFLDRDGTRYFFIPTFRGIVQGSLDDIAC